MPDLETRLRRDLDEHAAGLEVASRPSPALLARVRRRRQIRGGSLAAAVLLATCLLGVVTVADRDAGRTELAAGRATDLLRFPPTLTGTIGAAASPCVLPGPARQCYYVRFGLATPAMIEPQIAELLPDGRSATPSDGDRQQWVLNDPGGGPPVPLGPPLPQRGDHSGTLQSVRLLPDGRVVMLAALLDRWVLRTVDPRNGFTDDRPVPKAAGDPRALAVGPDGSIAVLGSNFDEAHQTADNLVVIRPDGQERHLRLPWSKLPRSVKDLSLFHNIDLSWGASGLIAISPPGPVPLSQVTVNDVRRPDLDDPHPGWTLVMDAASGERVAYIEGWQGMAWSPDGQGLLLAQRDGRASNLAVWWGPGLSERIDAGRAPVVAVPKTWTP